MTDTQLTWIGIVSQAIPTITAILMVTVGNWMIKRRIIIEVQRKVIWLYVGKKITKSISWNYCPNWDKPIYKITDNGARKGIKEDSCYDLNIHFWHFVFSYTNWNYNYKLR